MPIEQRCMRTLVFSRQGHGIVIGNKLALGTRRQYAFFVRVAIVAVRTKCLVLTTQTVGAGFEIRGLCDVQRPLSQVRFGQAARTSTQISLRTRVRPATTNICHDL